MGFRHNHPFDYMGFAALIALFVILSLGFFPDTVQGEVQLPDSTYHDLHILSAHNATIPFLQETGIPFTSPAMRILVDAETEEDPWPTPQEINEKYLCPTYEEALALAQKIDFRTGMTEHPSNMCGPLAAAILEEFGLLPDGVTPADFWLANPDFGRPASLFPDSEFDTFTSREATKDFDFSAFPLHRGDFLYLYGGKDGDHMITVTEAASDGKVYGISNVRTGPGINDFVVQRDLLYDPSDPDAGVLREGFGRYHSPYGCKGFILIRSKNQTELSEAEDHSGPTE
ncbi:MAG: hypothetical protein JXD21_00920 [Candidatus Omnitrophica bacterium]|nr:hypothetical protein [Candidatus Omnitrophota bacterium]